MDEKLEHFSQALQAHQDKYILIGGNACGLVFESKGQEFRQTQDLDIVLVIEEFTEQFSKDLWAYLHSGKYQGKKFHQSGTSGNVYRFVIPNDEETLDTYPKQIELFSRKPDDVDLFEKEYRTPIETAEGISNFSAILVDDDYYSYLKECVIAIETVNTVHHMCLMVLKAKAWIGNKELLAQGKIKEGDVHKHPFDICRLLALYDEEEDNVQQVARSIYDDLMTVSEMFKSEDEQMILDANLGGQELPTSYDDTASILPQIFSVKE
ncbi:hypothetical protein KW516_13785 [Vibrio fluvialis]|nr:hypothetical protein [Vibrio fluvialis]MBY8141830.1 hypothetical protein [Vibrio fluvialis]MBY8278800.1 hypothetical protein [Vibrio fluvialis]HDM8234409.1 hypothetical protein [Vibrio campbellii]